MEADSGDSREVAATSYRRRVVDNELDELLAGVAAVSLEGPKAVGKTATALRRAATVYRLDDEASAPSSRPTHPACWRAIGPS